MYDPLTLTILEMVKASLKNHIKGYKDLIKIFPERNYKDKIEEATSILKYINELESK
ncbi:MAG: hypothetical protein GF317_22790 [Candidatus Lokiarchaeota archaeon]|nr:hypothetical protein [Candidatus Lokiarchaeota archaeon]